MTIRLQILDVGHGMCAYIEADNRNLILVDCGHKCDPTIRPSDHLYSREQSSVERLFITNFDEDHISDLPNVRGRLPIGILHKNPSISVEQLRALKLEAGPLTPAMEVLLEMMTSYTFNVTNPPELPDISWSSFWHSYGKDCSDTNNISLATVFRVRSLTIIFPGDLETEAWEKHLKNPEFREALRGVNVFVASHHGRENGYCRQVFDFCSPGLVVISDGTKQYATQEMVDRYAYHATGVQFNGKLRKVLTTRNDGSLVWEL